MSQSLTEAAWRHCPWGMAAIGNDGNVLKVNPAFERCTGTAGATLPGMSEAAFAALLGSPLFGFVRVETQDGGLRALYYLRLVTANTGHKLELSRFTEALREPLASIYGFAELLLTQDYDEETRRDLTGTLLEQVEALTNIINEQHD